MGELAKKLHDYAEAHYEYGFDFFVECGMEYCEEFVDGLETWEEVLDLAKSIVGVIEDRRADAEYHIKAGG